MKNIWLIIVIIFLSLKGVNIAKENSIFEINVTNIDGEEVHLRNFEGNVILIVNTASRCGYTKQYKSLEKIYNKYKDHGFMVLAFPSNDFKQELASNKEVKEFCEGYKLSFPIFAKGKVKGLEKQQLFKFLTEGKNGGKESEIRWNFEKFIISRKGELIKRFRSSIDPSEKEISLAIESLL
tara:strand:+ start:777 stop:1319 length:543 start_codon:yes stop_codon:yes gene_type:complete